MRACLCLTQPWQPFWRAQIRLKLFCYFCRCTLFSGACINWRSTNKNISQYFHFLIFCQKYSLSCNKSTPNRKLILDIPRPSTGDLSAVVMVTPVFVPLRQNTACLISEELMFKSYMTVWRGRDSSVGIATRYRLGGQGIESRWGRDFPHPSRPSLGPTHLYNGYRVLGVKCPGRGVDHPLPI